MKKAIAILMVFLLLFSLNASVFAVTSKPAEKELEQPTPTEDFEVSKQGYVNVEHYDVSGFPTTHDKNKWLNDSLKPAIKIEPIFLKKAQAGNDNWTQADDEDAFLLETSNTTTQAAMIITGYIKPEEDILGLSVVVDDGVRWKMGTNNVSIVNSWTTQGHTTHTNNSVILEKDEIYEFEVEYFNWGGKGSLELSYKQEGTEGYQIIPRNWFYAKGEEVEQEPEPNFWITVDDEHEVYFNGSKLKNPDNDWSTVDEHIVKVKTNNLIAVKGMDTKKVIAGFIASLDTGNGRSRIETDGSWWYTLTEPKDNKWREEFEYAPPEGEVWLNAFDITNDNGVHGNWPTMPSGNAHWIWSPDYIGEQFDFTVWFRNIEVQPIPVEEYNVYFNMNDEDSDEATPVPDPNPQIVEEGECAKRPTTDPTWAGHSFQYWEEVDPPVLEVRGQDSPAGFDFEDEAINKDTYLKAVWKDNAEVTVYFNPDNGNEPFTKTVLSGRTVAEPESKPIKEGYIFKYWDYENSDRKASVYTGYNFELSVDDELYLIAVYDEEVLEEYNVYFNMNDGDSGEATPVPATQSIKEGSNAIRPTTDPTWAGHSFQYWEEVVEAKTMESPAGFDFDTDVDRDIELKAVWEDNAEVIVYFNPDNGNEPFTKTVLSGRAVAEPDKPFKSGWTFSHWKEITVEEMYEGPYAMGYTNQDPFSFDTLIIRNTQLLAIYDKDTVIKFEITFDMNDEDSGEAIPVPDPNPQIVEFGKTVVKPTDPTWAGHEFLYWQAIREKIATIHNFPGFNFEIHQVKGNLLLRAMWEDNEEVTVYFDADGGIIEPDPITVLSGRTIIEPTKPSKSGYTFSHWKEIECDDEEEEECCGPYVIENTLQDPFDFGTSIVRNTCLLAIYNKNEDPVEPRKTYSPNAVKDYLATDMNGSVLIKTSELMSNDSHANNFVSVQKPSHGSVKLSGNTVTFTPDAGFSGNAKFYYTIEYKGKKDEGLVVVQVNAVIIEDETPLGASNKYVIGYPKGSFESFNILTRAELGTMYARLLSLNYQAKTIPQYTDAISTSWYAPYINILKQTEILVGYANNTFNPNGLITRAELASSIARYYEMMSAYTGTSFMPDRVITRVETIKVLNKLFGIQPIVSQKPSFNDISSKSFGFGDIEAAAQGTIFSIK
jgi:hypothetical protein